MVGLKLRVSRLRSRFKPPEAAIPPEEDTVSIDAALAMRATFAQYTLAVFAIFDALVGLLTGCERKQ